MRRFIAWMLLSVASTTLYAVEIDLSGSVVSDNQKMITSRYMGYVKQMAVAEGDIVKKGQLLYEIDSKEIESAERQVDRYSSTAGLACREPGPYRPAPGSSQQFDTGAGPRRIPGPRIYSRRPF